jgi:hypothetical protein
MQGVTLEAWLYEPLPQAVPVPVIIMGHGLGSQVRPLLTCHAFSNAQFMQHLLAMR